MDERLHIRCVMVPLDGSECSRFAAEYAIRIALEYGAEVVFVHVVDELVAGALAAERSSDEQALVRERLHAQGRAYTRDAGKLAENKVPWREEIGEGDPCAVICDIASRVQADLIVMGKSGRRGARRILMGSVARRVIETTDIPVLVISLPPDARRR